VVGLTAVGDLGFVEAQKWIESGKSDGLSTGEMLGSHLCGVGILGGSAVGLGQYRLEKRCVLQNACWRRWRRFVRIR